MPRNQAVEALRSTVPNINGMLGDLFDGDGRVVYGEGDPPYPLYVIESAVDMGLVHHYFSGGMQSTDVTIELTRLGRERVGLPPITPWYTIVWRFVMPRSIRD